MNNSVSTYTKSFWQYRAAKDVTKFDRIFLFVLFTLGVSSLINFGFWWFQREHIANTLLFGLLSFLVWYSLFRQVFVWYTYLNIKKPKQITPKEGLSVAIFTTSYKGEPIEMVRKTLEACKNVTYPHTTYLLDNTEDPEFKKVAEENGAVWLELINIPGAKAGKVNTALSLTNEDYILILDPDHIPFPNFLDKTLGYFEDPKVGFVQVAQTYYNQNKSFTAKGAAEQTYTFYSASEMGYYGMGSAVAIGANCTFRRAALDSIGGHVQGLAEDLQTSLKLHAHGWKSVYNPVVVSRGIVPEDFNSFCKQQLKWAVGASDVLFTDLPNAFRKLSVKQRLTYTSISTYYLGGIATLIFILLPFLYFFTGILPVDMDVSDFVLHGSWVAITSVLFYIYMQKWLCHPKSERGLHWHAMVLKFATWPVFLYGSILTLTKKKIPYLPTAKRASRSISRYTIPLIVYLILFAISSVAVAYMRNNLMALGDRIFSQQNTWIMMGFALLVAFASVVALVSTLFQKKHQSGDPWDKVNLDDIKIKTQ